MASAEPVTDHRRIREWAEERGAPCEPKDLS